jgi:hypothetical protein
MITDSVQEVGCLSDFKIHRHKFIYELDIQYRNNYQIMVTACKIDLDGRRGQSQRHGIDII